VLAAALPVAFDLASGGADSPGIVNSATPFQSGVFTGG